MTDIAAQRRYLAEVDALAAQYRAALGQRTPTSDRVAGALYAYIAPRLGMDERVPDMNDVTAGLDRGNFRARRHMVADRIRKMTRGRGGMGKDVDLSDLESLLDALEGEEEGEDRRRARDEVEEPGMSPALDPEDNPWEAEDAELEELKSQMSPEAYDRLRRRASDRRRARDEESPYESFDRKRTARDDPSFPGAPRTGGGQYPMENANVDRPGFGQPRDIAAKDKRAGRFDARPRSFGQDSAPSSFERRFGFTGNTTIGRPSMPGIKLGTT